MHFGLLPNILGFSALILYILTLIPGLSRVALTDFRRTKFVLFLMKYRREFGLATFAVALAHGILIGIERNLNFLELGTIFKYVQGITAMIILILLALTSNDFSVKKMKRNWKRLHSLTYLLLFILPWHIVDKMNGHWSVFTPLALGLLLITLYFFAVRIFKLLRK